MRTPLPEIARWFLCTFLPVVMIPSNAGAAEPVIKFSIEPVLCIPGVLDCYHYTYTNQPRQRGTMRVFVLATNGTSAKVTFDASESYDPDGDPIEIIWSEDNGESEDTSGFIALGPVVTNEFLIKPGERETGMWINLSVNDAPGINFGPPLFYILVSVYTPVEVVASISETVSNAHDSGFAESLRRILKKTMAKMEQGDTRRALRYLEIFKKRFESRSIGLSPTQVEGVRMATDLIAGLLSSEGKGR